MKPKGRMGAGPERGQLTTFKGRCRICGGAFLFVGDLDADDFNDLVDWYSDQCPELKEGHCLDEPTDTRQAAQASDPKIRQLELPMDTSGAASSETPNEVRTRP